jgi:hypothetical protein
MARTLIILVQALLLAVQPGVCTCAPAPHSHPAETTAHATDCQRDSDCGGAECRGSDDDRCLSRTPAPCEQDGCPAAPLPGQHAPGCPTQQPSVKAERAGQLQTSWPAKQPPAPASPHPTAAALGVPACRAVGKPPPPSRPLFLTLRTLLI